MPGAGKIQSGILQKGFRLGIEQKVMWAWEDRPRTEGREPQERDEEAGLGGRELQSIKFNARFGTLLAWC